MHGPEFYEKKEIRAFLDSIGAWHCLPATYGYGSSGAPDILACYAGKFIGIEVKREGKILTSLQYKMIARIQAAGGIAVWGTAEKVIKELKELLCT